MIHFTPYRPDHLAQIALQPAQEAWRSYLIRDGFAESLAVPGMAWTGFCGALPVGCAGLVPHWRGRVTAWALFGRELRPFDWPAIVRKVRHEFRATLQEHGRHRVEMTVPSTFGPGCRLAKLLGFTVEGLMPEYGPDGSDHLLYGQILPEVPPCA